jgi:hypothetical protein
MYAEWFFPIHWNRLLPLLIFHLLCGINDHTMTVATESP